MSDKKADNKDSQKDAKPEGAAEAPKKKGGMKFVAITVALLAIEGGVLFAVFSMGGPKDVQASHVEEPKHDAGNDSCEVQVFTGSLFNDATGINYGFKVEVFVKTKAKHRDAITKKIEDSKAELRAEIAGIWRQASSADLSEPMFESLRRRIEAKLKERINAETSEEAPSVDSAVVISTPPYRQDR